jgi:hypothetical protein
MNAINIKRIYEIKNISLIKLIKLKNIKGFNRAIIPIVIHAIYP